ncbi:MAG: fused MFS/spermidine synthase [Planctomycetes bacterium]|nr:fused MFS/spermidine synthase [Planctomycetota bacterium]
MRGDGRLRALEGIFFVSGACALVYETVWARWLGLALGADAWGIAAVLAGFMAGFGIGSAAAGALASRVSRPGLAYGLAEVGIALCGFLSPLLLPALASLTPALHGLTETRPALHHALRFALAVAVLLAPATLLGATFPLMARLRARPEREGEGVARLYAWNTLGAASGAALSAFVLVPGLGLAGSTFLAAAMNLLAGAAAIALYPGASAPPRESVPPRDLPADRDARVILAAAFLSGFASLAQETLLTRALVGALGASTYAFACVLTAFLAGIGIGPHLLPPGEDPRRARRRLAGCQVGAVWGLLLGILAISHLLGIDGFLGAPRNRTPEVGGIGALFAYQFLVCCAALLPSAVFLGAAFPAAIRAAHAGAGDVARTAGRIYAANTAGAILGTLLAAFVALPFLGLRASLAASAGASLLAAVLLFLRGSSTGPLLLLGALSLPAGGLLLLRFPPDPPGTRTIFHEEGSAATVSVEETTGVLGEQVRGLRVEGKIVATSGFLDMRLQRLLGVLPVLASADPSSLLTVGLGTGMTGGSSALASPGGASTVVEIAPPVARGAAYFDRENHGVLRRSRLRFEDGRNFLLGTRERFGVITTDPIHPWTAGSGSLYTVEYFRLVASRLAAGGAVAQWVPLYEVSESDVRSIAASFAAAFPRVALFLTGYDLVLLGRTEEIAFDAARVEALFRSPEVAESLREIGILSAADLLATYVAGDEAVRAYVEGAPVNLDDRPEIEYSAPRSLLSGYAAGALRWVLARETRPTGIPVRPSFPIAPLREALDRRDRALRIFLETYEKGAPRSSMKEAVARYVEALRSRT